MLYPSTSHLPASVNRLLPRFISLVQSAILVTGLLIAVADSSHALTRDQTGKWAPSSDAWNPAHSGNYAIHLLLLRGDDNPYHSRILWWSNDLGGAFRGGEWGWKSGGESCDSFPQASSFGAISVPPSGQNLFCSGAALLPDGRMLAAGGSDSVTGHFGENQARIWKDSTGSNSGYWIDPGKMKERRWYPTVTALANGGQLVLAGSRFPHHRIFGGRRNGSVPTVPIGDSLYRFAPVAGGQWDRSVIPAADDTTNKAPLNFPWALVPELTA